MIITAGNMDLLWRGISTKYGLALSPSKAWSVASGLLEILPMTTLREEQYWLANLPPMQRLTKDKVFNSLSAFGQTITAAEWDLSFAIKRKYVKYDQWGLLNQAVIKAADRGSKLTDFALSDFLMNNPMYQTGTGAYMTYDQQPYFSTQHPINGNGPIGDFPAGAPTVQSNLLLNTPLTVTNFAAAVAMMMSYLDETGRPWSVTPDTLIVGPALRHIGKEICEMDLIADVSAAAGSSTVMVQRNPEMNTTKLVVVPEMWRMPQSWMLVCSSGTTKPFVWAQLEAPHLVSSIDPTSVNVFKAQEFWYSVEALGEIAPTLWPLAIMATGGSTYGT